MVREDVGVDAVAKEVAAAERLVAGDDAAGGHRLRHRGVERLPEVGVDEQRGGPHEARDLEVREALELGRRPPVAGLQPAGEQPRQHLAVRALDLRRGEQDPTLARGGGRGVGVRVERCVDARRHHRGPQSEVTLDHVAHARHHGDRALVPEGPVVGGAPETGDDRERPLHEDEPAPGEPERGLARSQDVGDDHDVPARRRWSGAVEVGDRRVAREPGRAERGAMVEHPRLEPVAAEDRDVRVQHADPPARLAVVGTQVEDLARPQARAAGRSHRLEARRSPPGKSSGDGPPAARR